MWFFCNVEGGLVLVERQAIEVLHLEFLRVFGTRVDRALYVLKGGCNLRFFARSSRPGSAHMILRRFADQGFLVHLARGRWLLADRAQRLSLPALIAAPYSAYVSLQSALFHHGLIEQIPAVIYAVTLGRPRRVKTALATVSLHRLPPELFRGYELMNDGIPMATPEKALFDVLYLALAKTRLFARLPELTLPRRFGWKQLSEYVEAVKSPSRRGYLRERIDRLRHEAQHGMHS